MDNITYRFNCANNGKAGLIYSNNEYLNISISNGNFENNFIMNYRNQPDV